MRKTLTNIKHLIIDMDGVLYRGHQPIPGLGEFFTFLRQRSIGYILATNNSTRTPAQYARKLAHMGVTVRQEEILTSAQATAAYLAEQAPPGTPVYVIGQDGLVAAMQERGYIITTHHRQGARFVVVGMDTRVTYDKLKTGTLLIRAGAQFIGTNPDKTFPSEEGIVPGAGSILAALEAATDVKPIVIGKPEPPMFQQALARLGASPQTTAVLGDRLETDILGGQRAGLLTICVLSGVTSQEDLARSPIQPDLVFRDIAHLVEEWASHPLL